MTAIQTAKREVAVAVMNLLVADKQQIDYVQHRPMHTIAIDSIDALVKALSARIGMDCSESTVLVFHIAGLKDPTGNGYDGEGNTESMLANTMKHFSDPAEANPCSLVIFDADQPLDKQHVAIVHTADKTSGNPLLFTHGHQGDPSLIRLRNLQPGFQGKTVFLSVASL